jgi:hypothetical protein
MSSAIQSLTQGKSCSNIVAVIGLDGNRLEHRISNIAKTIYLDLLLQWLDSRSSSNLLMLIRQDPSKRKDWISYRIVAWMNNTKGSLEGWMPSSARINFLTAYGKGLIRLHIVPDYPERNVEIPGWKGQLQLCPNITYLKLNSCKIGDTLVQMAKAGEISPKVQSIDNEASLITESNDISFIVALQRIDQPDLIDHRIRLLYGKNILSTINQVLANHPSLSDAEKVRWCDERILKLANTQKRISSLLEAEQIAPFLKRVGGRITMLNLSDYAKFQENGLELLACCPHIQGLSVRSCEMDSKTFRALLNLAVMGNLEFFIFGNESTSADDLEVVGKSYARFPKLVALGFNEDLIKAEGFVRLALYLKFFPRLKQITLPPTYDGRVQLASELDVSQHGLVDFVLKYLPGADANRVINAIIEKNKSLSDEAKIRWTNQRKVSWINSNCRLLHSGFGRTPESMISVLSDDNLLPFLRVFGRQMYYLNLRYYQDVNARVVEIIQQCPNLCELHLQDCSIKAETFREITGMLSYTSLEILAIPGNPAILESSRELDAFNEAFKG